MRRLMLLAVSGALLAALTASAAFAQEENSGDEGPNQKCWLPEGCFISGDASNEILVGGAGPDHILGGAGHDAVYGLRGNDRLDGGAGNDMVRGGAGHDLVDGGSGHDIVVGGAGDDYVTGYLGHDSLYGGPGNDYIYAADGTADHVFGGKGYDVCVVDAIDFGNVWGCEEIYIG